MAATARSGGSLWTRTVGFSGAGYAELLMDYCPRSFAVDVFRSLWNQRASVGLPLAPGLVLAAPIPRHPHLLKALWLQRVGSELIPSLNQTGPPIGPEGVLQVVWKWRGVWPWEHGAGYASSQRNLASLDGTWRGPPAGFEPHLPPIDLYR